MSRTIAFIVFTAIIATGIPARPLAQSPPPRVAPELLAKAASGTVRVIVRLAAAGAIAAAQDAAIESLPGAQSVTRFQTQPAFAATLSAESLARLLTLPGIVDVYEDKRFYPALRDSVPLIHTDRLVPQGVDGTGWQVAVLDTGVEKTHSFYAGRISSEACYSSNGTIGTDVITSLCPSGATESTAADSGAMCTGIAGCNHGTIVAGIAVGRNSAFAGVARRSNLISMKIFSRLEGPDACGTGQDGPCLTAFESDVVRALERVGVLAGAGNAGRVASVNLSVAGDLFATACDASFPALAAAVSNLRALGIATIVPSGNSLTLGQLAAPACLSSVVSVASSGKTDLFSGFSNRSSMLSLVAPGEHIETSVPGDTYLFATGTSIAAPHVAGAWAVLKSVLPSVSVDTALNALRRTGVPLTDPNPAAAGATYPRIVVDRAAGSLGPAGSPTSLLVSTAGPTVTMSWSNPFDGSVPQSFQLELALASSPDVVIGSLDVGLVYIFGATLPQGHYLVRVRAMTASGPGAASNFVPFSIGPPPVTAPPDGPHGLRAVVNAQTVSLFWNLAVDSAPVESFYIDVGSAPGATNVGTFDTMSSAMSAVAPNVFPGTYYVRVRGRNALGVSPSSNEVRVYVPATGCADAPTDLVATVFGSSVTLAWNPPFSGPVSGYTIEVGTRSGLADVISLPIGTQRSVSANAVSGTFYVRVRTRTPTCSEGAPSNEVVVVVP